VKYGTGAVLSGGTGPPEEQHSGLLKQASIIVDSRYAAPRFNVPLMTNIGSGPALPRVTDYKRM